MTEDRADGKPDLGGALDAALFGHSALVLGLVLGYDTGLLDALLAGPTTAGDLADRIGTDRRMTLEWLRVMVVAGFAEHADGVFRPRTGLAEAMNPSGVGSRAELISLRTHSLGQMLTLLAVAVRTGAGVPHSAYEPHASRCQDMFNLTTASGHLLPDILEPIIGVAQILRNGGSVLDLGCGGGWALAVLAKAYPGAHLTGYDLDQHALSIARTRLAEIDADADLECRDAANLSEATFDLIIAIDTIHDLGDPSGTLAAAAAALRPAGIFVMAETEATGDFETDSQTDARWEYFTSLAMCIPVSQAAGGPGLGSLWGRSGALPMLAEAGFAHVDVHSAAPGYAVYAARANPARGTET